MRGGSKDLDQPQATKQPSMQAGPGTHASNTPASVCSNCTASRHAQQPRRRQTAPGVPQRRAILVSQKS